MRPVAVILLVVALGLSGLTVLLAKRFLDAQADAQRTTEIQHVATAATEPVLVAARDLKSGTVLKGDDLRWESWPQPLLDKRFVVRGAGDDPQAAFVGAVLRRAMMAGEPFGAALAARQDEGGTLAAMMAPGMRAISVAVSANTQVTGFVQPGDRIDVMVQWSEIKAVGQQGESRITGGIARFASETLLRDVRVLAIDGTTARADSPTMQGKNATLEVTPKEAETLLTALRFGELSLVLRALADGPAVDAGGPGYTSDTEISKAVRAANGLGDDNAPPPRLVAAVAGSFGGRVRINRGGSTSVQSFGN